MVRWQAVVLGILQLVSSLTVPEIQRIKNVAGNLNSFLVNNRKYTEYSVTDNVLDGTITFSTNSKASYLLPEKTGRPKPYKLTVWKNSMYARQKTCVPTNEPVGITLFGSLIYSVSIPEPGCPQTDVRKVRNGIPDSEKTTQFDRCGGMIYPYDRSYRVYQWSECLSNETCGEPSGIIGVALDGFPIYGPFDDEGRQLTSSDLDECHGRVDKNGKYKYHATVDYPYFVSCFKGVIHEDSGLPNPVPCTCPCNDTSFIQQDKIPFENYSIAYEWSPIYENITLFPCTVCTKPEQNKSLFRQDFRVCRGERRERRFVPVIVRRLKAGRLPPDMEWRYYEDRRLFWSHRNQNEIKRSSSTTKPSLLSGLFNFYILFVLCLLIDSW